MEKHMTTLFSELIDFFEEEKWKYEILEGETIVRFHYKGTAGRLLCYGEVDENKQWVLFYSYLPVNVPMDKLGVAAEFVCRANQGMRIGNFELDFEDGEVRYKTSIDVEGGELAPKMIDNLLRANLSTMNRYFPGLMKLIFANMSAKEAIESVEGNRLPSPNMFQSSSQDQDEQNDDDDLDDDDLDLDSDLDGINDFDEDEELIDKIDLTSDDAEEGNDPPPESENEAKP